MRLYYIVSWYHDVDKITGKKCFVEHGIGWIGVDDQVLVYLNDPERKLKHIISEGKITSEIEHKLISLVHGSYLHAMEFPEGTDTSKVITKVHKFDGT